MIHVCVHSGKDNSERRFACGIVGKLPEGDIFLFESEERRAGFRDEPVCPGCYPEGKPQIGTPISQLATQPGCKGYAEWLRISESWGQP